MSPRGFVSTRHTPRGDPEVCTGLQIGHVDKSPKVYTQLAREGVVLTQDSDNI